MRDEKTILLKQANQYGTVIYYPACAQSDLLAELAKTKTLTTSALKLIKSLGYKIELVAPANVFND